MLLYLALGVTTTQFALRRSLDALLAGEDAPFTRRRQVALTALTVGSSLGVALVAPGAAERIVSVVGATGVCVCAYVIPVAVQLRGHRRGWRHPRDAATAAAAARYLEWHRRGGGGGGNGGGGGGNGGGGGGRDDDSSSGVDYGSRDAAGGSAGALTAPLLRPGAGADAALRTAAAAPAPAGSDSLGSPGPRPPLQRRAAAAPAADCKGAAGGAAADGAWVGVVEPLLVLAIGVGSSLAALYVAVAALFAPPTAPDG